MHRQLITSREAADLLGVSASSVKRWADEGVLPCVRTAGHHRRFERAAVDLFRRGRDGLPPAEKPAGARADSRDWIELLLADGPTQAIEARLLAERARLGGYAPVADELGPALVELGRRWASGEISIVGEHLASERLARALARIGEWLPVGTDARRALLVTAEGDDHCLGLALAELTLREAGWATLWAGRRTPLAEVARALELEAPVDLVVVSASVLSSDAADLARQARILAAASRGAGAELVLGGEGPWPSPPPAGVRLHRFVELRDHLLRRPPARERRRVRR